jgi:antitoxin ParD1/3/4
MNVSIGKHFQAFVERAVRSGRYRSSSEVVRAGLRLLEEREHGVAALKRSIDRGLAELDRGEGRAFDAERIKRRGRERLAADED